MATDMKEKFEIKNYVKLICLRLDHYESFIEDKVNTDCISDINDFILKHKNEEGVKILIFEMKNMRMTTISQAREYIQHLHAFDYIRGLIESGHDLITSEQVDKMSIGEIITYMLDYKKRIKLWGHDGPHLLFKLKIVMWFIFIKEPVP